MSRKRTLGWECLNKHFSLIPQTCLVIIIKPGLQMIKQTQKGEVAWAASHSWEIIRVLCRLTPHTVFPLLTLDLKNERCGHLPQWGGQKGILCRTNQNQGKQAGGMDRAQVVQHSWSTGFWEENSGWKSGQIWLGSQIWTSFSISRKATEALENFSLG